MTDYFKLAESALNKVTYFGSNVQVDANRLKAAEIYAQLAYAQAIKGSGK